MFYTTWVITYSRFLNWAHSADGALWDQQQAKIIMRQIIFVKGASEFLL